jgi:hypothetical protein
VLISTQVRWLQKFGNPPEEYEDAFAYCRPSHRKVVVSRLAVADGATEASFSRQWARLLVRAYRNGIFANDAQWRALPELQRKWQAEVSAKPLPWYAVEKLQMGAYSSLVGLTLHAPIEEEVGKWEALAIGDSCLFQIHNQKLIVKWPLDSSAQFNNSPILLSTKHECNEDLGKPTNSGNWSPGDLFYLMTDAMAQYYLRAVEQGGSPESAMPNLSAALFSEWVIDLRSSGKMRNDDVTFLRIDMT